MLNYAIIGCGGMSGGHLRGLAALKNEGINKLDLVAVCDICEERLSTFAVSALEQLGKRPEVYTSVDMMLEEADIAASGVNTHHRTHHVLARKCIEAGKHVLIEKPLALTPSLGRELIGLAEQRGVTLAVAENYRRSPACRSARESRLRQSDGSRRPTAGRDRSRSRQRRRHRRPAFGQTCRHKRQGLRPRHDRRDARLGP